MYDHSSVAIISMLFVVLILAIEVGYRIGSRYVAKTTDSTRAQINTMQGSMLGVLALLLGFTFSLSLQRYDSRSEAVIDEANAIGTTILRAELLPVIVRKQTQNLLQQYLNLRIQAGDVSLDRADEREALLNASNAVVDGLWQNALLAADAEPNPVTSGLFIQALNEMIDAYGSRDAALDRHVPEPVLFLLFGTFILTVSLVGFTCGITGHRAYFPTYVLVLLIVFMVFLVIDLDRPRRGLIEVSHQSLVDLAAKPIVTRAAPD